MHDQSSTLPAANSARDEWRRFARFLRDPRLPESATGFSAESLRRVLQMLGLDLAITAGLLGLFAAIAFIGFDLPDNALSEMELGLGVVLAIVIAAPLVEELLFRAWLSGRPGHIVPIIILMLLIPTVAAERHAGALVFAAAIVIIAAASAWLLRKRPPMTWFARLFAFFFPLSTLAFALVHLTNYQEGSLPVLLPLVLPQLATGTVLAFVRVTYGLWSSVLVHAAHNGIAVGVVLFAESQLR